MLCQGGFIGQTLRPTVKGALPHRLKIKYLRKSLKPSTVRREPNFTFTAQIFSVAPVSHSLFSSYISCNISTASEKQIVLGFQIRNSIRKCFEWVCLHFHRIWSTAKIRQTGPITDSRLMALFNLHLLLCFSATISVNETFIYCRNKSRLKMWEGIQSSHLELSCIVHVLLSAGKACWHRAVDWTSAAWRNFKLFLWRETEKHKDRKGGGYLAPACLCNW